MFIAALLIIAKTWKQLKCPSTEDWIKKMYYVYNWTEKDKYHMTQLSMCNLKTDTYELIYKTETDSQTQKTNQVTKGEVEDELGVWD